MFILGVQNLDVLQYAIHQWSMLLEETLNIMSIFWMMNIVLLDDISSNLSKYYA